MKTVFLDCETYCETPIKHGLDRYAEDVEITVATYAVGEGPVVTIDYTGSNAGVIAAAHEKMLIELEEADEIVLHNSRFDRTVMRHAWGLELPTHKIVDTMIQAMAHSLPGSLDKLCAILGVETDDAKDKAGSALIQLLCKPRPKNQIIRRATRETHPIEWQRFLDYAGSDIRAMRKVRQKLPSWNYPANIRERELWQLDQKINDRGIAVDVELAEAAVLATEAAKKTLAARCVDLTDGAVQKATQRDQMLAHILAAYGVELPDMRKSTLERRLQDENLPEPLKELLRVRLMATVTSTAKYKSLMRSVSSDGKLRGTLQFCGAKRTGRWAGRLFQPQNLPRGTMKYDKIEQAIADLKSGNADLVYDNVMDVTSNTIRAVLTTTQDHKLVSSDLANIEGRCLAWLAGEVWKLEAFRKYDTLIFNPDGTPKMVKNQKGELVQEREGPDLYIVGAAEVTGKRIEDVDDDDRQKQGKVPELSCGYQGAVGAFQAMSKVYGMEMSDKRALEIVKAWRKANPNIVDLWYGLERAAIRAVDNPGLRVEHGKLVLQRDGSWLRMKLPSGRLLCYPGVQLVDGKLTYMGENNYTRKWERLTTYGGKLVENATQAMARDVLAWNMPVAEAAGFELITTVHDELVTQTIDSGQFTSERLSAIMSTVPPWATGLPLAASGWEGQRYRK